MLDKLVPLRGTVNENLKQIKRKVSKQDRTRLFSTREHLIVKKSESWRLVSFEPLGLS